MSLISPKEEYILDIFLPHSYSLLLCGKVCFTMTFSVLWQEAHKTASKNLAQEEQLPRHHLNSACDFTYAAFFWMLRPIRHFRGQLKFTSSNTGKYYPSLNSLATNIKCWLGRERMLNKIWVPILLLIDSPSVLGTKPGMSCVRVPFSIKQL